MIFYFSGTGNSFWVAKKLSETFGEQLIPITKAMTEGKEYSLSKGEGLGFVFPVYSWGPPQVVLEFLHNIRLSDTPDYPYFVCTCGDDTGKTTEIMQKNAPKGWNFQAGYSVIMPNTYVAMPGFDVDAKQEELRKLQEAEIRILHIAECLTKRTKEFDCNEGKMPWTKTYIIRPLFNRYFIAPKKFHVSSVCIGCGICEKVCPLQNISMKNGHPIWSNNCAMCLSCYHHCPKHAIEYGNSTKQKGQYLHPSHKRSI